MRTAEFIEARTTSRARALKHAVALLCGDASGADEALSTWRFAPDREVARRVLLRLVEVGPLPYPKQMTAFATDEAPFADDADRPELSFRREAIARAPAEGAPDGTLDRLAWALDELSFLGREIERKERAAWRAVSYRSDPARDAETSALWLSWFEGAPWDARRRWESAFLPAVRSVFRAALSACRVPGEVRMRSLADLDEAFFFVLLGSQDALAGWLDVAARVIETGENGPVESLARALPEGGWPRLAQCAAVRGHWPAAAGVLVPDVAGANPLARALEKRLGQSTEALEGALDLHVALRVIDTWKRTTAWEASWSVVLQNRGRARSRLRALVASGDRAALSKALLRMEAIHDRTLHALKRFAWAWAYRQVRESLAFDAASSVTAPCEDPPRDLEPLSAKDAAKVRSWTLLATLKGRLVHLERWVRTGGTGDRDSTWARLLTDELPPSLRDPEIEGRRAATYQRLRTELVESLDDHLAAIVPWLERIAGLERSRDLRARFEEVLGSIWDPEVAFPKSGFPTFLDHAQAALERLRARRNDARTE